MGIMHHATKVPEGFKPNAKQENYLKAVIARVADSESSLDGTYWFPGVEWDLLKDAVSAADARTAELMAAGYLWQYDDHHGGSLIGLSDAAIQWAMQHLAMPDPSDFEALFEYACDVEFDPKPEHREGATPGVKNMTSYVAQEQYTPDEAKTAIEAVDHARTSGLISGRSAAGYKNHIARRTVVA